MKKIGFWFFVAFLSVSHGCEGFFFLGLEKGAKTKENYPKSVVWEHSQSGYSVSDPQDFLLESFECKGKNGYVLVNNPNYSPKQMGQKSFALKKGWNLLEVPKDGIDVIASFDGLEGVEFVYVYDKVTEAWAGYSPKRELMEKILRSRILGLRSIEPDLGFYVYATQDLELTPKAIEISGVCKEKMQERGYSFLQSSGLDKEMRYEEQKAGVESRYSSHYKRGIYDDTRVVFIYPKVKEKTQSLLRFGPAMPKVKLEYAKELEEKKFYIFDYKTQGCYEGLFPSMRIPPYPTLKKLK